MKDLWKILLFWFLFDSADEANELSEALCDAETSLDDAIDQLAAFSQVNLTGLQWAVLNWKVCKSREKYACTAAAICQIRRGAWTYTEAERFRRIDRTGAIGAVVGGHEITIGLIASFGDVKLLNLLHCWYSLTPAIGKGIRAA